MCESAIRYDSLPIELAEHVTEIIHPITNGKVNSMGKEEVIISSDKPLRGEVNEIVIPP